MIGYTLQVCQMKIILKSSLTGEVIIELRLLQVALVGSTSADGNKISLGYI